MILRFTRHGETEWNVEGRIQGWHNSPLTSVGRAQAAALRARLEGLSPEAVYVSPLGRARETEAILRRADWPEAVPDARLREVGMGTLEGRSVSELGEAMRDFRERPERFMPEGGEGYPRAYERVAGFLNTLEREDGSALVVSHAMVLRLIRIYMLGLPISRLMDVSTPGCCDCEARFSHGVWTLYRFGEGVSGDRNSLGLRL